MDEAAMAAFLGRTVSFVASSASSPKRSSSVAGLGASKQHGDDGNRQDDAALDTTGVGAGGAGAGAGPLDRHLGFGFEIGVADPRHCDIFSQSNTFTAETQ